WTARAPRPAGAPAAPRRRGRSAPPAPGCRGRRGCAIGWRPPVARPPSEAREASFDLDLGDPGAEASGLVAVRRQLGDPQAGLFGVDRFAGLETHLAVAGELAGGEHIAETAVVVERAQLDRAAVVPRRGHRDRGERGGFG